MLCLLVRPGEGDGQFSDPHQWQKAEHLLVGTILLKDTASNISTELKMLKYLDPYYSNLTTAEKCIFTELLQLLKSKVLYILTAEDYGKVVLCFCFFF